jgi:hypothetical protein
MFSARVLKSQRMWTWTRRALTLLLTGVALAGAPLASSDEGGVSFWLPGNFGSLAAVPGTPGWTFAAVPYYTSVAAGADVAKSRDIEIGQYQITTVRLAASLASTARLIFISPSYVFETPILGGQASVGVTWLVGDDDTSLSGTLTTSISTPPGSITRPFNISSSISGGGDLYPLASLKWNWGVHNLMIYGMGDIPTGAYQSNRLANLGIGHGAMDGGAGYTYLNNKNGHEFSAVAGFTYNFTNTSAQYQNGVDFHLDWGASQFLSDRWFVGAVGYVYQQVSGDSGSGDRLGSFKSRVLGAGPQIGYLFPVGHLQGFLNLKGYWEFDAQNRPSGHNFWLVFAISPAAPAPAAQTAMDRR